MIITQSMEDLLLEISKVKVPFDEFSEMVVALKDDKHFPNFGKNSGEWRNFLSELYFGEMLSRVESYEIGNFDLDAIDSQSINDGKYYLYKNYWGRVIFQDCLRKDLSKVHSSYEYDFVTILNGVPLVFEVELNLHGSIQKRLNRFDLSQIKRKIRPLVQYFGCDVGVVNVLSKIGYESVISSQNSSLYSDFIEYGGLMFALNFSKDEFERGVVFPIMEELRYF